MNFELSGECQTCKGSNFQRNVKVLKEYLFFLGIRGGDFRSVSDMLWLHRQRDSGVSVQMLTAHIF